MVAVRHARVDTYAHGGTALHSTSKKIVFSLACFVGFPFAIAQAAPSNTSMDECKRIEESAQIVMEARQAGAPMSKIWKVAENTHDDYLEAMFKMLVKSAYEVPRFETDAMKKRATVDFQDTYFSACISNLEKKKNQKT
ncbi:hypothetical protein D3C85_1117070 [compost metagenome]